MPSFEKVPYSLSMLGWALNEEENVARYIERAGDMLAQLSDDFELILIDDGSTDHTVEIIQEAMTTRPWLRLHINEGNRGPGYNTRVAIGLAQKDYLFWQTVDWAYDITNLMESLNLLADVDVLQGVRIHEDKGRRILRRRSDNSWKAIISLSNYYLIRILFSFPVNDFQNVTVYPRELIQSVKLESESSFTNPECLLKTYWQGATIREIPTPFIKRSKGVAKGTRFPQLVKAVQDILKWWVKWVVLRQRDFVKRGTIIPWDAS